MIMILNFVFFIYPQVAWDMASASENLRRAEKSRAQLTRDQSKSECVDECSGKWKRAARQVLANNGLERRSYCGAVYDLLEKERGKYRNILITGPANCAKTFMLSSLTIIFKCDSNPASNNFAWIGVESSEIILLNNFRWSQNMIPWHDLLLLLEQLVNFAVSRSHFSRDISLDKDTPIYCTTKVPFVFIIKGGAIDEGETEMFHFPASNPHTSAN